MPVIIIVGAQWGDEGKGKVVDLLAAQATHVVRGQGGNNAGHTVVVEGKEHKLHLLPTGILHTHVHCHIGAGTAIDPAALLQEMSGLSLEGRLWISPKAHLIMPYHKVLDTLQEARKGNKSIGTTGKGIGPCYTDRAARLGLPLGLLMQPERFSERLKEVLEWKNREIALLYESQPLSFESIRQDYLEMGERLRIYLSNVEFRLADAHARGETILMEGAQGTLLDVTFGTYPYVTSSCCTASGICQGAGLGPSTVWETCGVMKAFTTRVGNGPMPTEDPHFPLQDHTAMREVGTTTGRKRRLGWFDAVLARSAVALNGLTAIALMKLDILDTLTEIKVCVGYQLDGTSWDFPPESTEDFFRVQPIYVSLKGWNTSTRSCRDFESLPKAARDYIDFLQTQCGVPIRMISVGPDRAETIRRERATPSA